MRYLRLVLCPLIFLLVLSAHPVLAIDDAGISRPSKPQVRKEEVRQVKEAKRADAKERFAVIRDERKRTLVERVENSLDAINERRTDHFARVLERLSSILEKILSRADAMKSNGTDVSAVEAQVQQAQSAIAAAQEAVRTQAAKDYSLEITDETTVKEIVSGVYRQLQADLKATGELVRKARAEVAEAFQTLARVAGVSSTVELPD